MASIAAVTCRVTFALLGMMDRPKKHVKLNVLQPLMSMTSPR